MHIRATDAAILDLHVNVVVFSALGLKVDDLKVGVFLGVVDAVIRVNSGIRAGKDRSTRILSIECFVTLF
jgi:hypothetical protein